MRKKLTINLFLFFTCLNLFSHNTHFKEFENKSKSNFEIKSENIINVFNIESTPTLKTGTISQPDDVLCFLLLSGEALLTVDLSTDLWISIVADNASPNTGDVVTFTITATNNGPDNATNVVVTENIPSGYTVQSVTPSNGTWSNPNWTIGNLVNGASETLTVVAIVNASGVYDNTATISGNESDPDSSNNSYTETINPVVVMQPFICNNYVYQVQDNGGFSSLYQYDMNNGSRTLVADYTTNINAIGYDPNENLIVGFDYNSDQVVRLDASGQIQSFTIPNLPANDFNVGTVIDDNYLFLYRTATARYYVVDINPSSSTYMQLVDPTNAYTLETTDFGTVISPNPLSISDIAYNATAGLLVGIIDPGAGNQYKIVTLDPTIGTATFSAVQVSGAGIQGETSAYGSQFTDINGNFLYVFTNNLGNFYAIDLTTYQVTLLSNSTVASSNDGANCPGANFSLTSDLSVTKTVDNATPNVGDNVTFTITVTNNGSDNAANIVVTENIPSGYTVYFVTPSNGTWSAPTWTIGNLANGASETLTVVAGVNVSGVYDNTVTVNGNGSDPDLSNNSDTETVNPLPLMQPFVCDNYVYQVQDNGGYSSLYQYDMSDGTRTLIHNYTSRFNAIGYDPNENLIVGYNFGPGAHGVVRLAASGMQQTFAIPNLPDDSFNVGTVINSNYLFLYQSSAARYYVVDINSSSSTYMQLVDPTNAYVLETADFGTIISMPLRVSDIAYNTTSGNLVGLIDPAGANEFRVATLDPITGTVNINATQVSGAGIQGETSAYGSQFTDLNDNFLYVFANNQGNFYTIDLTTYQATLLSTSTPAGGNDGANCPGVSFSSPITDLSVTKTVNNATANVGDTVTFTITATNNGPDNATNVVVTENIPSGYTVTSVTPSNGTWGVPTWTIGNLANGASETLTVVATVNCSGDFTNIVSITGSETDDNLTNNEANVNLNPSDVTPPSFVETLPIDATVECDAVPIAPTLTATDNCGTATVTFNEVSTTGSCVNNYTLTRTWTATDASGNITIHIQTIIVQDTTAPTFVEILPTDLVLECTDVIPTAPVLTAMDNCSDAIVVYDEQRVDGSCASNYQLIRTWTATDVCGNETTHVQIIEVQDTTPPVFTGDLPQDDFADCDNIPVAPTLTATDNCGNVTVTLEEQTVEGDCSSRYQLIRTWTATDDCGNSSTYIQTIALACHIKIWNALSLNDDGSNDILFLEGIDCYPNNKVEIYNRWGVKVFESSNYDNVNNVFRGYSDGRSTISRDEKLPTGTYFYVLKYEYSYDGVNGKQNIEKAGYLYIQNK